MIGLDWDFGDEMPLRWIIFAFHRRVLGLNISASYAGDDLLSGKFQGPLSQLVVSNGLWFWNVALLRSSHRMMPCALQ